MCCKKCHPSIHFIHTTIYCHSRHSIILALSLLRSLSLTIQPSIQICFLLVFFSFFCCCCCFFLFFFAIKMWQIPPRHVHIFIHSTNVTDLCVYVLWCGVVCCGVVRYLNKYFKGCHDDKLASLV